MFSWNSPYVLAFLLGLVAVGLFHFDQKQKKIETNKMSYVKVFTLVTGSIISYNYFVNNNESDIVLTNSQNVIKELTEVISHPPVSSSLSGLYGNLKIKEGPPNF